MSKIEQTLEEMVKAEKEAKPFNPAASHPSDDDKIGISIRYKHTKIMEVSEATLLKNRLLAFFDHTPTAEQYKILKTTLLQRTAQAGMNTLMVTSTLEGEGKSVTAANLAISLAKELHQTVLLIDADLRRPSLHTLFGLHPSAGLSDYLLNQKSVADLLITPGIDKLTILPGNKRLINSTEIMGSLRMRELVREVKHRYQDRYIIFDSPPVLGCADPLILAEYVDGIIFVVEYGKTQQPQIEKALHILQGKNVVGMVLNKYPRVKEHNYYY